MRKIHRTSLNHWGYAFPVMLKDGNNVHRGVFIYYASETEF